jgi:hypothetical protein
MKSSRLIYALAAAAVFVLPTAAFAQSYDGGQNWQQQGQWQNGDDSSYQRGGRTAHDRGNRGDNRENRWNRDGRNNDDRNYAPPQRDRYYRGYDNGGNYGNGSYYGNGGYDPNNGYDNSGLRVIIRF